MNKSIYLDYNATAPMRPEAIEVMSELLGEPLNASSVHSHGRSARKIVEEARAQIAALCGAPAAQVVFNSGATEGNNTVLQHFEGQRVLVSAIEHPSVLEAAPSAEHIPVTTDGLVNLSALEDMLKAEPRAALVSVMLVNNESGTIQPIKEISALAHRYGALLHCDGVQAAGRIPVDIAEMGIDFITLSAHKIGGPQGIGALAYNLCGQTPILLHGGGQEKKARAGTENVAGIAGFGAAAKIALQDMEKYEQLATWRGRLEDEISQTQGIQIHGRNAPRVAGVSLFSLKGVPSESMLMNFDLEGIAISNGSACTSGSVKPSHVLEAMGADKERLSSALRVSMGWNTRESDIDRFLEVWSKISKRIQAKRGLHG